MNRKLVPWHFVPVAKNLLCQFGVGLPFVAGQAAIDRGENVDLRWWRFVLALRGYLNGQCDQCCCMRAGCDRKRSKRL